MKTIEGIRKFLAAHNFGLSSEVMEIVILAALIIIFLIIFGKTIKFLKCKRLERKIEATAKAYWNAK